MLRSHDTRASEENRPSGALALLILSSDTFPPNRVDVSVLFGEELAGRGHRLDWILQSAAPNTRPYVVEWGGGLAWVGRAGSGKRFHERISRHIRGALHDLRVFGLARKSNYDIIQVKDKFVGGLFALSAARLFHKRFVYWLSWPFPEEFLTRARDGTSRYPFLYFVRGIVFKFILYRILMPAADHIFVQSEQMRSDVAREGVSLEKMTAVPMGVRLPISPRRGPGQRRRIPVGAPAFVYLGILTKVRRLDFLVRVLLHVRERVPDALLYFVGGGDDAGDYDLLISEAERLGLRSAVEITGQLPRQEALEYVEEADVCVSPFFPIPILNSTSPTKLVEYMAMGKPVVANDHPEQRRLIEESGAGICVPWDVRAFGDAVSRLLLDSELAGAMGASGPGFVAAHREYRIIANQVELELLRVASGPPRLRSRNAPACGD